MELDKHIFEKNVSLLKQSPLGIAQDVFARELSEKTNFFSSQTGDLTAQYDGRLLHSKYDPVAEGEKFAENLSLQKGDHVLLYGFSLGYHITPLLDIIGPEGALIVLELNSEIFAAALRIRDCTSLFSKKNLQIICGGSEKEASALFVHSVGEWSGLPDERKKIAIYTPSYLSIPPGYEQIKNAFELFRMEKRFDTVLGDQNRTNTEKNQELVKGALSVASLFGAFKDRPGFLIGSGPSLDNILRNIKYIPKKSVIVAVDSALTALLENGIRVDFVISVDPQVGAYTHMEQSLRSNIPLIFMPQTNPHVLRHHEGKKYLLFKDNYGDAETKRGSTQSGGAVSCVGLDMLIQFGANPIILAGLDSCFPWGRFYSNEVTEGKSMMDFVEKHRVARQIHLERVSTDELVDVDNCFGTQVSTHRNLFSYLRATEQLLDLHKNVYFILWGSHGASIRGCVESYDGMISSKKR